MIQHMLSCAALLLAVGPPEEPKVLDRPVARDAKKQGKDEAAEVKVEVRAKLHITGKLRKLPILERGQPARLNLAWPGNIEEALPDTGATLWTQLGHLEVYFGGDVALQELAAKLEGKTVLVVGELDRVRYFSWQGFTPEEVKVKMTSRFGWWPPVVTKTFIRARRIEAAPVP